MLKPRFTPEIQLGHLIQASVFVLGMGGSVLGAYLSLTASIARQDTRVAVVEMAQKSRESEDSAWRAETRAAYQNLNSTIVQLSREISDLRVGIANKADRK